MMFHRYINHVSFQDKVKLRLNFHIFKYIIQKDDMKIGKHLSILEFEYEMLQIKLAIINFEMLPNLSF